jgi:hypothetical protein
MLQILPFPALRRLHDRVTAAIARQRPRKPRPQRREVPDHLRADVGLPPRLNGPQAPPFRDPFRLL